ncbi:Metallo-dependent phosphatase-like protein [Mycena rebaudengoi]|nr:Metallo-dependent phosphatase-like protein [Mycena rebaudengoi]
MFSICFTFIAAALASCVAADSLVSELHLHKRFIDSKGNLNVSIIHTNDIHAHLDEFRSGGNDCRTTDTTCFGGYARIKTKVDELRGTAKANSTILLDGTLNSFAAPGDQFHGTIFYTYYKGEKIAETINQLGYDAGTLGNHEFDGGDAPLADYLANLTFPIICANIKTDTKKLSDNLVPFHILKKWDIAVVSVLTPETKGISNPDENTSFLDPVETIQKTIDIIRSTTNITRIIALTHIGYEEDIALATKTKGLSLIIGGHSHTPLGKIATSASAGEYPTIAKNLDGDEVFVVTAWRWGEVLGHIEVAWDPAGKIVSYEGAPIDLNTNTTKKNTKLDAQIQKWREPFVAFVATEIAETKADLVQDTSRA